MEFRDKPMQNLIRIKEKEICKNVQELLLDGEQVVGAYKTVRDQAVFTTHRIFLVDMQGVTGTRQEIFVLPYRKVLHFGIKTAGFGDPLQTSELTVCFADEHEAKFGFIGQEELLAVALQVAGLAVVQVQQNTAAAGSDLLHETIFIKILNPKHKNTSLGNKPWITGGRTAAMG